MLCSLYKKMLDLCFETSHLRYVVSQRGLNIREKIKKFNRILIDATNIKKTYTLLIRPNLQRLSDAHQFQSSPAIEVILQNGANLNVCQFGKGRTDPIMHARFLYLSWGPWGMQNNAKTVS